MPEETESPGSGRDALLLQLLESYKEDYRELCSEWRAIETKAQGTVTIAGVFIAAVFAFLDKLVADTVLAQKILLALALLGLVVTVLLCVVGLRVREVYKAPMGEGTETLVNDLLRLKDDQGINRRLPGFRADQISEWKITNESLLSALRRKATFVNRAQVVLVCTLATIGLLALTIIFGGRN